MSRPSRRKYGWGIMRRRITRSPLFPGPAPSPPLPVTRIVEPSCAPAGILTLIRSPSSVMPAPPHCGHPRRPDRPDPRHAGHALGRRHSRSPTEPLPRPPPPPALRAPPASRPSGSPACRARPGPPVLEIPNGALRHAEEIDRELHGKVGSPPGGLREATSPEQVPEHVPEIEWFPPAKRPGVEIGTPGPPVRAPSSESPGEDPFPHRAAFRPFLLVA